MPANWDRAGGAVMGRGFGDTPPLSVTASGASTTPGYGLPTLAVMDGAARLTTVADESVELSGVGAAVRFEPVVGVPR